MKMKKKLTKKDKKNLKSTGPTHDPSHETMITP